MGDAVEAAAVRARVAHLHAVDWSGEPAVVRAVAHDCERLLAESRWLRGRVAALESAVAAGDARPGLFRLGDFTLASGAASGFKIDCDALTPADWAALAAMAVELLPLLPFTRVVGVPRGGVPFADALAGYATEPARPRVLFAEDVVTSGGSVERFRADYTARTATRGFDFEPVGVCVFARGRCPPWVHPLFRLPGA